jgi:hypothetical protein
VGQCIDRGSHICRHTIKKPAPTFRFSEIYWQRNQATDISRMTMLEKQEGTSSSTVETLNGERVDVENHQQQHQQHDVAKSSPRTEMPAEQCMTGSPSGPSPIIHQNQSSIPGALQQPSLQENERAGGQQQSPQMVKKKKGRFTVLHEAPSNLSTIDRVASSGASAATVPAGSSSAVPIATSAPTGPTPIPVQKGRFIVTMDSDSVAAQHTPQHQQQQQQPGGGASELLAVSSVATAPPALTTVKKKGRFMVTSASARSTDGTDTATGPAIPLDPAIPIQVTTISPQIPIEPLGIPPLVPVQIQQQQQITPPGTPAPNGDNVSVSSTVAQVPEVVLPKAMVQTPPGSLKNPAAARNHGGKPPASFDSKGVGSTVGLGKVFYFLEQMKCEITEADRNAKSLQKEVKFLKEKNKELEAKSRDMEKRWKEEKANREVAESKSRQLKKRLKEVKESNKQYEEANHNAKVDVNLEVSSVEPVDVARTTESRILDEVVSRSNSLDNVEEGVSSKPQQPSSLLSKGYQSDHSGNGSKEEIDCSTPTKPQHHRRESNGSESRNLSPKPRRKSSAEQASAVFTPTTTTSNGSNAVYSLPGTSDKNSTSMGAPVKTTVAAAAADASSLNDSSHVRHKSTPTLNGYMASNNNGHGKRITKSGSGSSSNPSSSTSNIMGMNGGAIHPNGLPNATHQQPLMSIPQQQLWTHGQYNQMLQQQPMMNQGMNQMMPQQQLQGMHAMPQPQQQLLQQPQQQQTQGMQAMSLQHQQQSQQQGMQTMSQQQQQQPQQQGMQSLAQQQQTMVQHQQSMASGMSHQQAQFMSQQQASMHQSQNSLPQQQQTTMQQTSMQQSQQKMQQPHQQQQPIQQPQQQTLQQQQTMQQPQQSHQQQQQQTIQQQSLSGMPNNGVMGQQQQQTQSQFAHFAPQSHAQQSHSNHSLL